MVALALATSIPAREWRREDDATIATALTLLKEQADEMEDARRGHR